MIQTDVSGLEITKTKTEIKKYTVQDVGVDYFECNDTWREAHGYHGGGGTSSCFACGCVYKQGDDLSLALTSRGNVVLCHDCGTQLSERLMEAAS